MQKLVRNDVTVEASLIDLFYTQQLWLIHDK